MLPDKEVERQLTTSPKISPMLHTKTYIVKRFRKIKIKNRQNILKQGCNLISDR